MQSKKKKKPNSKIKSFYLSCRNHIPCSNSSSISTKIVVSPIPILKKVSLAYHRKKISSVNYPSSLRDDHCNALLVEMQWQRMHKLEKELVELEEWLCTEIARLKNHLRSNNSNYEPHYVTKFDGNERDIRLGRLDGDGGYIYSLNGNKKALHGTCKDLVIQFSSPSLVPHDIGSNISEVLSQMAAMGKENLMTWLLNSMPMTDISIKNTQRLTLNQCNTPNDVLEAILLEAIEKLGRLVIEGLHIQKGVKEVVKQQQDITRRRSENGVERIGDHGEGNVVIIMAMLIQARDPHKGYEAVNEMMIGFVEAVVKRAEDDEESGFIIKGVHVAGLVARKRNGEAIHNCLWHLTA
uniref:PMI1/PMIR1-2 C-terminal domain-containing protein n=1 Tax=Chenopodium quinoa TaxID=63459 RepID=A0A803MPM0_CHEQI